VWIVNPALKRVSVRNIKQVYPHYSDPEVSNLVTQSRRSLARFIVDSARFHTLDGAWVKEHVEVPFAAEYLEIRKRHPGKGILVASGHLGSIEIQALAAPFVGRSFSFVARDLKHKAINDWWKANRQKEGNIVISREGAVKNILANLRSGIDVAILIDQNVRVQYALFVDWFGRPAATTFALGRAAVETEAPVVVSAITYIGNEKYRVNESECSLEYIYRDESLSKEEKIFEVTRVVSKRYQELILQNPTEWFWMHSRWRTTPVGVPEDFYKVTGF
jgi:KDO2-lipid IV(A) lauroyltransferase